MSRTVRKEEGWFVYHKKLITKQDIKGVEYTQHVTSVRPATLIEIDKAKRSDSISCIMGLIMITIIICVMIGWAKFWERSYDV